MCEERQLAKGLAWSEQGRVGTDGVRNKEEGMMPSPEGPVRALAYAWNEVGSHCRLGAGQHDLTF